MHMVEDIKLPVAHSHTPLAGQSHTEYFQKFWTAAEITVYAQTAPVWT